MHKRACSKHVLELLFFFGVKFSLIICYNLRHPYKDPAISSYRETPELLPKKLQIVSFPWNTQSGTIKLTFYVMCYERAASSLLLLAFSVANLSTFTKAI
jgi:hypothetical protein